jgi:hypothetical protein
MFTLRCTERLRKALHVPAEEDPPVSMTALGDWCGQPVATRYARMILLVSERSRLPVLVAARRLDSFEARFRRALEDLLRDIGIPAEAIRRELAEMQELVYARTNNRSVLGTMNDYTGFLLGALAEEPEKSLHELAVDLSELRAGPLGYEQPREVARALLSAAPHGVGV